MRARIVCLPGDGIGPEVMQEAVRVLTSVACAFGHSFTFVEEKLGKAAIQAYGTPLGEKTLNACRTADAVLLGASSDTVWDNPSEGVRPESGLRLLQSGLNLYAGLQHCAISPSAAALPLREGPAGGVDMVLVWPLSDHPSRHYKGTEEDEQTAADTVSLSAFDAEQVARLAFRQARERRKSVRGAFLGSLDATTRLFLETANRVSGDYPDVTVKWLEAGRCAEELLRRPDRFDMLLLGPALHLPLSGIAAGLMGGFGLVPLVMLGDQAPALYLPAQGEEASLAGRDMISPIAMILCAAMMLRKSLRLTSEADCVEMAVKNVLDAGWRTADMVNGNAPRVGTQAIGKLIAEQVDTAGAVMGAFRG